MTHTEQCSLQAKLLQYFFADFSKTFRAFDTKVFNSKQKYPKAEGLGMAFLEYNSDNVFYIIVDIDFVSECGDTLEKVMAYVTAKGLPLPTWILQTTKGFHIGWKLKTGIPTKDRTSTEYRTARAFLTTAIFLLHGDFHAARLSGIWRNPLNHPAIINDVVYSLEQLSGYCEQVKSAASHAADYMQHLDQNVKALAQRLYYGGDDEIPNGKRNTIIWYLAMGYAKYHTVEKTISFINEVNEKSCNPPLEKDEIGKILASVLVYKEKHQIYIHLTKKIVDFDLPFREWGYEHLSKYRKEYYRQVVAVKNKENRLKNNPEKKIDKTAKLVAEAQKKIAETGKKVTIAGICRITSLHRHTVRKYLKT